MRIKFQARPGMLSYRGDCGTFEDSQVRDVDDKEAQRLLDTFPDNFSKAGSATSEKQVTGPAKDKAVKGGGKKK